MLENRRAGFPEGPFACRNDKKGIWDQSFRGENLFLCDGTGYLRYHEVKREVTYVW